MLVLKETTDVEALRIVCSYPFWEVTIHANGWMTMKGEDRAQLEQQSGEEEDLQLWLKGCKRDAVADAV